MLQITKDITTVNKYVLSGKKNEWIVIHNVGDVSSAKNNASYFRSEKRKASANYFVDDSSIYQVVEDKDAAWHCGDSGTGIYKNQCNNKNSIGIEMCQVSQTLISEKTLQNTVELVKYLMNKYNIDINHVIRHSDVTSKECPTCNGLNLSAPWNAFKARINGTPYTAPTTSVTVNPNTGNSLIKEGQQHSINFTGNKIAVDGIRGKETIKNAVRCIQVACGLKNDGIRGDKTNAAMKKVAVKKKDKGLIVTAVEILMMLKGYNPKGVECPGIAGSGLDGCIRQYQKDHGLKVDGCVGYNTLNSLLS